MANETGDATFYLMADGGSGDGDSWRERLAGHSVADGQKFLVHVGSAIRRVDDCDLTAYYKTQHSLSASPVPAYSLPGNNDWPACTDPNAGWTYYQELMHVDEEYWNATESYVVRRQPRRTENFAFLYLRVMFVGLHVVTNSDANETSSRLDDDIDWVMENVDAHREDVDAVFLMGYGRLLASENAKLYDFIKEKKENEWKEKLVVYARRAAEPGVEPRLDGIEDLVELKVPNDWPIMDVRVRTRGPDRKAEVAYRLADQSGGDKNRDEPRHRE